jgi:hypothetical protein
MVRRKVRGRVFVDRRLALTVRKAESDSEYVN